MENVGGGSLGWGSCRFSDGELAMGRRRAHDGPRRFGRRNSGEMLGVGPLAVAKCESSRSDDGRRAHRMRGGYFLLCGVNAEGGVYPAISRVAHAWQDLLGDCSRFIEQERPNRACSVLVSQPRAGRGLRSMLGTWPKLGRDRPGLLRPRLAHLSLRGNTMHCPAGLNMVHQPRCRRSPVLPILACRHAARRNLAAANRSRSKITEHGVHCPPAPRPNCALPLPSLPQQGGISVPRRSSSTPRRRTVAPVGWRAEREPPH
jgi:hypothetical protein